MSSVDVAAPAAIDRHSLPVLADHADDPELDGEHPNTEVGAKKKKKKKPKKSASAKARDAELLTANAKTDAKAKDDAAGRPPVLCISRNKHWRYISSYHVREFLLKVAFVVLDNILWRLLAILPQLARSRGSSRS
jgi:hypothetical protein